MKMEFTSSIKLAQKVVHQLLSGKLELSGSRYEESCQVELIKLARPVWSNFVWFDGIEASNIAESYWDNPRPNIHLTREVKFYVRSRFGQIFYPVIIKLEGRKRGHGGKEKWKVKYLQYCLDDSGNNIPTVFCR